MTRKLLIQTILIQQGIYACPYKAQWILDRLPKKYTTDQILLLDSLVESHSKYTQ